MAKVVGPLHSSEARGRMGGLVYNTWRGLNTVKQSTAPAQPRSALQMAMRATGVSLARTWATLTAAARADWNIYAANHQETDGMGSPKRLTGMNWYLRLNQRLIKMAKTQITVFPAVAAPTSPLSFSTPSVVGYIRCLWAGNTTSDWQMWIHVDGPHSIGRIGSLPKAKFAITSDAALGDLPITPKSPGVYTVYARYVDGLTGLASPWVTTTATVT